MERKSTWRQDFARNKYKYLIFLPVTMYRSYFEKYASAKLLSVSLGISVTYIVCAFAE